MKQLPSKAVALIALFGGLHFLFTSYKSSLVVETEKSRAAQSKRVLDGRPRANSGGKP